MFFPGPDIFVPFIGVLMILGLVLGPAYFRSLDRQRMHETLRVALEKGQPLPAEMIAALQSESIYKGDYLGPGSDLRRGIVLLFTGFGVMGLAGFLYLGLSSIANDRVGMIVGGSVAGGGCIPALIGLAYLLLHFINRDKPVGR